MPEPAEDIAELIHRRRRQILVHAILYYNHNANLIPDATYDLWSYELEKLKEDHPAIYLSVDYRLEAFKNWTGASGFSLPLDDPRANSLAKELMKWSQPKI